jgi:RHS repeat-associated protein
VVQRTYTYGVQRISENQFFNNAWVASFYEYDGEGSVRQLTSSAGTQTDAYEYDAFGNEINHTGTTANNYLYRGEQWDSDLSLYYLRARYYNPLTGRFLSVDSQADEGQRRYEYAAADPANGMDPTGDADVIEFELLQFRPVPLQVHFPSWCQTAGTNPMGSLLPPCAPPPPSPPPCNVTGANCCPQCFAQLKYRAVFVPPHGNHRINTGRNHSFWYVQGRDGVAQVIDAGPADEDCSFHHACGLLVDWPPFNSAHGHYQEDNPGAATEWSAPQSDQLAGQVAALESTANSWNSQHRNTWYRLGGTWNPNSNTFAHDLGNDAGFNNVSPPMTAPPNAPGW